MIKNRTSQLIYQSFYCALGLVGIVASFGIFDDYTIFRWDFYIHLTNLTNFFCIAVMVMQLIQTAKKKEDSFVSAVPILTFIGVLALIHIFVIFNILLAGATDRDPQLNWRVGSLLFHVVLPFMYILGWFLFYERRKVKWYYPIVSGTFPLAYVLFLVVHAALLNFDSSIMIPTTDTPLIYPYFFINLETQGVIGAVKWGTGIVMSFIILGFVFFGLDKIPGKKPVRVPSNK